MSKSITVGIAGLILVLVSVFGMVALNLQPVVKASSPVPQDKIKHVLQLAYGYIKSLERSPDSYYSVISEYPDIPIVVTDNLFTWWVPGLTQRSQSSSYPWFEVDNYVVIHDSSVSNSYYGTTYTWYMDLHHKVGSTDYKVATLKAKEYRGYPYSYVSISVVYYNNVESVLDGCHIYLAGKDLGSIGKDVSYTTEIPDSPIPSMRTSVRHVDVLGSMAVAYYNEEFLGKGADEKLWDFARIIQTDILGDYIYYVRFNRYDIYDSLFQGLGTLGLIDAPNELHFYDAHWFDRQTTISKSQGISRSLGYYVIWDFMSNVCAPNDCLLSDFNYSYTGENWIWRSYPIYPYKSKIVAAAEKSSANGGTLFLDTEKYLGDPLYKAWEGSYDYYEYLKTGVVSFWDEALNDWNSIVSAWDGTGIKVSGQVGYSTVRLAAAVAFGSLLAGHGVIGWGVIDDMANVLVQLQWPEGGTGEYSPDGQTVIQVAKPDSIGGFYTSYGKTGSYGFVPFRPSSYESVVDTVLSGAEMPPEYGGIIPTNAETTIVAMMALMQYYNYRYGTTVQ